jgi:hypothetical protein
MGFLNSLNRTKSDFNLFINRKQLRKVAFTEKCKLIIQEKMSFEKALLQLPEFLEIVEITKGNNKINIDNKFGKFLAIWDNEGQNLQYFDFRTRKDIF